MGTHPIFESDFDCLTEIMNEVVRAAGLLIFRRSQPELQFLLLKRPYRRIMENVTGQLRRATLKWFQKTNDPGEDEFTTALRETKEEAGLTRENLEVFEKEWTLRYNVKSHIDGIVRPKTVRIWLAEQISGTETISEEYSELSWGNAEESCNLLSDYKDMQELVHDAVHFIKSNK